MPTYWNSDDIYKGRGVWNVMIRIKIKNRNVVQLLGVDVYVLELRLYCLQNARFQTRVIENIFNKLIWGLVYVPIWSHYSDVIMSTMVSHITGIASQRASGAENVSGWWHHHAIVVNIQRARLVIAFPVYSSSIYWTTMSTITKTVDILSTKFNCP